MRDRRGPGHPSTSLPMVAMLLVGLLLLFYPWLAPGLQGRVVKGVPLLLLYFFAVWGWLIALVTIRSREG
ncbi:MAG TPA: hypothetical protein V6D05_18540 [Stenomitos sp.]